MTEDEASRYARGIELFRKLNPAAAKALEEALHPIAPDLARYASEFAFGDVYARDGLSKRERQIATLACLATRGDADGQLRVHLEIARSLGLSDEEIVEIFIQLAPYAGFPTAINAVLALKGAAPES